MVPYLIYGEEPGFVQFGYHLYGNVATLPGKKLLHLICFRKYLISNAMPLSARSFTLTLFILLFTVPHILAQRPTIDDFTISGDTYRTEDDCFRLTEEEDYSSGSIWYERAVSLSAPFAIELQIMLGCQDGSGADGMVFIFAARPNRTGYVGEGIGFAGLVPSLGIEIDTWRNEHLLDPEEDHIAFLANGRVGHFSSFSRPILVPNLEDCTRHRFVVRWQPDLKRLAVEIDGEIVGTINQDVVNQIFGGRDVVYWGMSAATGRYNNYHEVCFDRLSMAPPFDIFPDGTGRTK